MTKTFFCLFIFSRAAGIRTFRLKKAGIGNMFPICISDDLLNMCSEPFVMVLNVRAALLASTKVKFFSVSNKASDRAVDPW